MYEYQGLLKDILSNGEPHEDRTGTGTLSVFGHQFRHRMDDGFPLLTTKKVPLRWVFEELAWFISGSTDESKLRAKGVDIWKEWVDKHGQLGPIYGEQWRDCHGIDQLARVFDLINNDPESRRIICDSWTVDQITQMRLPCCHIFWQIKCHPGFEMSMHVYMRSIDTFLGLPFNIASYGLLLLLIAHTTGYKPRDLIISFGDLHIYNNHLDQVKTQLERVPRILPVVAINESLFNTGLNGLENCTWNDIRLIAYTPYAKIHGDISI